MTTGRHLSDFLFSESHSSWEGQGHLWERLSQGIGLGSGLVVVSALQWDSVAGILEIQAQSPGRKSGAGEAANTLG